MALAPTVFAQIQREVAAIHGPQDTYALSLWRGLVRVPRSHGMMLRPGPTLKALLADVAKAHGLKPRDLAGPARRREVAWPRQEFMALAYATGNYSTTTLGQFLGGRDHATVIYGIRAHKARQNAEARAA